MRGTEANRPRAGDGGEWGAVGEEAESAALAPEVVNVAAG